MEGEGKKTVWGRVVREGEGRESMKGWQIKKGRKWEYREGKGWSSLPRHFSLYIKSESFSQIIFPNSYNAI